MRIGIITYDFPHLKTEQLVCRFIEMDVISEINLYALPFVPRAKRSVIAPHRPDMNAAAPTACFAALRKVSFHKWNGFTKLHEFNDCFVIGGCGILDTSFAAGKPIVNAHPGIIPINRGLDSFKWAIYNNNILGNTLHLINNEIDKGEILQIKKTPVFLSDTFQVLARRHYDLEIDMLANFVNVLDNRVVSDALEEPSRMRMSVEMENEMLRRFEGWKSRMASLHRGSR